MLKNENINKKLDNAGRIVIPKPIRYKAEIPEEGTIAFYTAEIGGRKFICLANAEVGQELDRYRNAAEVLEELGEPVPESLSNLIK